MHKSGVVLLIIGGVILLVGVVGLAFGVLGAKDVGETGPIEETAPDRKSVFQASAAEGPKTTQFKDPGEHQVWYVRTSGKPTVKVVDSKGADVFEPLSPNLTVSVNEFGELGTFTPASATETYTVTVEGASPIHVTHFTEDELNEVMAVFGGLVGGGCACALGGFLTVLGLILGLTLKKKPAGDA